MYKVEKFNVQNYQHNNNQHNSWISILKYGNTTKHLSNLYDKYRA